VGSDPNTFGQVMTRGDILTAKNNGILGHYSGGRFDGFTISGLQVIRLDQATGSFAVAHGTGSLARYRASGTIAADYLGNFTFSGVDIGLC
jgi:hypothetical protein